MSCSRSAPACAAGSTGRPGLRPSARFEDRDLAVTTDFRDVLAEALVRHLGCVDPAPVFPGYRISRERSLAYLAA